MLPLNNAHARETSLLDEAGLASLLSMARYARGIDHGATALLIALDQYAPYVNPNFAWFHARHASFLYVDRIIVSTAAQGHGLARRLYEDLFAMASAARYERIVCEVNFDPPNPASDAFHAHMGFVEAGRAGIHNNSKIVRYLEKALS